MAAKGLAWVDIGMAVLAGGFIAIVIFFRNEEYVVPLLLGYTVLIVAWAMIAELAAMRWESGLAGSGSAPQ